MPEVAVRFAVQSRSGFRSTTWKCWTNTGQGKYDVYLVNRALGKAIKTSFHETGYCQNAYLADFLRKQGVDEDNILSNRLINKWHQPDEIGKGITLAYRVVIPSSAVDIPMVQRERSKIHWIPAPPAHQAIEIAILFTQPDALVTGWPARGSMGTELIGHMVLANKVTVWLVHRVVDIPQFGPVEGRITPFQAGKNLDLSQSFIHTILFVTADDGSPYLMECATRLSESALQKLR